MVVHGHRDEAAEAALELISWLGDLGHRVVLPHEDADVLECPEFGVSDTDLATDAELALSLGGDGSMLRTMRLVADQGVPVLGIDFGHLGYLTEVEPPDARSAIERFFAGEHQVEKRQRVEVTVEDTGQSWRALNEVVVEKVDSGRTVRLGVEISGDFFTNYAADGLIVATPTGSTAYALSARGPIINPVHEALLLTPVAPHMLFDRSLVLAPNDTIRIEVLPDRSAAVALDGREVAHLHAPQAVMCTTAPEPARLVTFGPRNFHEILKAKFGLNDD